VIQFLDMFRKPNRSANVRAGGAIHRRAHFYDDGLWVFFYEGQLMTKNRISYRDFLKNELKLRQTRNSAYSLRAFARDLGIGPSRLTEILSAKEGLSVDRAVLVAERLKLADGEKSFFIDLVQSEHSRSHISKEAARQRIESRLAAFRPLESEEEFVILSDWYNSAILELIELPKLDHSVDAFAQRLGMRPEVVQEAIDRMIAFGYLARAENRWVAKEPDRSTRKDVPSKVVRQFHKQILERAASALETKPVEERDYFSVIFPMNAKNISLAKEKIAEFRKSLIQELNLNQDRDGVFCLSLQFFEMTERK